MGLGGLVGGPCANWIKMGTFKGGVGQNRMIY